MAKVKVVCSSCNGTKKHAHPALGLIDCDPCKRKGYTEVEKNK